jgi:hypothetical protein
VSDGVALVLFNVLEEDCFSSLGRQWLVSDQCFNGRLWPLLVQEQADSGAGAEDYRLRDQSI